MLQDLTRSEIVLALRPARGRAAKPVTSLAPALTVPAVPATPDLEECSLDNLKELADFAYRAGDRAFAEHCVGRLYALYDHEEAGKAAGQEQTEAAV